MKAYPKCKPSNIEWIGEIPEHWEIIKLKFTDRVIMGQSPSSEDYNDIHSGLPFLQGNAEFGEINPNPKIWCKTANKTASVGDVLVSVRAPIGAVNIADQEYGIGRGLCAIRTNKSNNKYLYYIFICLNDELNSIGTGSTYTAISVDEVENIKIPYVELPEQRSIARFLDDRIQKIDTLIEKKQKLIDLLKEENTATINQGVTRGLNPDAPLKDSGNEWLGEVPKHWEIKRINIISQKITNGYVGPTRDILKESGIRYLQSLHIKNNRILFDPPYYVSEKWSNTHSRSILHKGDVLIVQTGDIGQVVAVNDEFVGCNCHALIIISPKKEILGEFLSLFLNSNYGFHVLKSIQTGALHPHLNSTNVKDIRILIPNLNEQNQIIDFMYPLHN